MYRNIHHLAGFLLFLFVPLLQNCNTPPDVPRADSSDQTPMVYPVKRVNDMQIQSVSANRDNLGSVTYEYSDNDVSASELTSFHNHVHNLNGMKEPLDDESVQSTNPNKLKGEKQNQKQNNQQNLQ